MSVRSQFFEQIRSVALGFVENQQSMHYEINQTTNSLSECFRSELFVAGSMFNGLSKKFLAHASEVTFCREAESRSSKKF